MTMHQPQQTPQLDGSPVASTEGGDAGPPTPRPVDPEAGAGGRLWGPNPPRAAGSGEVRGKVEAPHSVPSEVEQFLGTAHRLWKQQRDRLERMEAAFREERFVLQQAYDGRIRALQNEASDALHDLDEQHTARRSAAARMLNALTDLREA